MRASKEEAERARQHFAYLCEVTKLDQTERKVPRDAMIQVAEFLNAAKRKLPTEAAYDRDAKARRSPRTAA